MQVSLTDNSGAPLQFGPRTNAGSPLSGKQATQPPRSSTSHLTSTESVRQVCALPSATGTSMTTVIYFHPKVQCTKSMVNWDVVAKVNPHSVPDYTDVLPDPFSSTSRLPAFFDLLQNQHAGLLERVKKHIVVPPCHSEDKLKTLWKCRRGNDCSPYHLRFNRAVSQVRFNSVMEYIDQGETVWNRQETTGVGGEDRFDDYSMLLGGGH
ncbi:hypothetical protein I312_102665 [Cryptococcus bacillisporus CA1280]|uniref:uncharacterized protein n=1 Tax=Cryptococcus bacillisporus CA1280 TaxID=1296109 RepID=UPI003367C53E